MKFPSKFKRAGFLEFAGSVAGKGPQMVASLERAQKL